MSTQPATRSLSPPLGTSGDLRRRFLLHHVPLAVASAVVLALFMSLPLFDASTSPHADIFSGTLPRERGEGGPILHAFFYGALLRATSPFTLLLSLGVIAVFAGQAMGVWLWRRRYAQTAAP